MDDAAQLQTALADRYSIEGEAGRGGMATVYLARDLRHHRRVALKVLSPELGAVLGSERFLAEIRVTANLQHPNLLPLFDSGEADGLLFYVMPFVEGETLRQRIDRDKQLPVDEAVRIAVAVANALDYAHRHGVIHRDLKPENILMHDGQPLVADFGIALAVSNAGGQRVTQTGLSLGTPQYMSPEQATGDRNIDGRTDIYSLGAVLYEMLTGEPPHSASTAQAIIARLMTEEPRAISASRRSVPAHVEAAVAHALEKLPADRFQTAKDFAEALEGRGAPLANNPTRAGTLAASGTTGARRWIVPVAIGLAGVALGLGAAYVSRPAGPSVPTVRFDFAPPAGITPNVGNSLAISADGRAIVFAGRGSSSSQLYMRRLGDLSAKPIPGTEGGSQPIFSADGRWILFTGNVEFKKIETVGGVAIPLKVQRADADGGDWAPNGDIVLAGVAGFRGLVRVPESGGTPVALTKVDTALGITSHAFPIVLGDGRTIVFALTQGKKREASRLAITSLDGGRVQPLDIAGIQPLGIVDGFLVYLAADGAVMGVPFDLRQRRTTGGAIPIIDGVDVCRTCNGDAPIRMSATGSIVTIRGSELSRPVVIDRHGAQQVLSAEYNDFQMPALSPDGRRVAFSVTGGGNAGDRGIWIYDLANGAPSRVVSEHDAWYPRWTRDGKRVVFTDRGAPGHAWWQAADGSSPAQQLIEAAVGHWVDVSSDARSVAFDATNAEGKRALYTAMIGSTAAPALFAVDGQPVAPAFSPDGRWIAYMSLETGRPEVYVRPYPGPGGRIQVSINGGSSARWINGGRALVYFTAAGKLEMATVTGSPAFVVQSRAPVFEAGTDSLNWTKGWDVSGDGKQLIAVRSSDRPTRVSVVLNVGQELRERAKR